MREFWARSPPSESPCAAGAAARSAGRQPHEGDRRLKRSGEAQLPFQRRDEILGRLRTALDFSKAMRARARSKHAGEPRLRLLLADAGAALKPEPRQPPRGAEEDRRGQKNRSRSRQSRRRSFDL